jgi:hypothetical protein
MNHREVAQAIIRLKRIARRSSRERQTAYDEIRKLQRKIKLNQSNPFGRHQCELWQSRIDRLQDALGNDEPNIHKTQELLMQLIKAFDELGPAPVTVLACILSTSHVHVERAIANGRNGLIELVVYDLENGANKSDVVNEHGVLRDACTGIMIRTIMKNKWLEDVAFDTIQEMAQQTLGRPLQSYQVIELPNGEITAKPMPLTLKLVKKNEG